MLKIINLHQCYFAFGNPFQFLERWIRPYCHQNRVRLNDRELLIEWTRTAQAALAKRTAVLNIEMQLYFSCLVKKRVLFHEETGIDVITVNDLLKVGFRSIQSAACSPEDFARDYPEARELNAVSTRMTPSRLRFDFRGGEWVGEFGYD